MAKFSVPAAKKTFPERRRPQHCAKGKPSRLSPDGRHSTPVPEKALCAPVAASVKVQSCGRYTTVVPFKGRFGSNSSAALMACRASASFRSARQAPFEVGTLSCATEQAFDYE